MGVKRVGACVSSNGFCWFAGYMGCDDVFLSKKFVDRRPEISSDPLLTQSYVENGQTLRPADATAAGRGALVVGDTPHRQCR